MTTCGKKQAKRYIIMKTKTRIILLSFVAAVLLTVLIFSLIYWEVITHLFKEMVGGVEIAKEYIIDTGIVGIIAITLLIVVFFFFPIISSVPVQIASAITYGLLFGVIHVSLSVVISSQLVFLFSRCIRAFSSKKQYEKQLELEEKIRKSKRSIVYFLFLAYLAPFVPFLLIHSVAASSGMKWWKYSLITLLGPLPDIIITLWLGVKVTSSSPVVSYIILMIIITCVVLSMIYKEKLVNLIFAPKKEVNNDNGQQ